MSAAPALSLPKGGGAVRGIGETFATNPVTGTGKVTLPLPVTPGRGGFGPGHSLGYDSGAGTGPFGLGWSLGLPAVTRRTDRGVPVYADATGSDVFLLAGAEDLVPELVWDEASGEWRPVRLTGPEFLIERFRPRTEGAFARIERWTRVSDGDTHWRATSRENITTVYGAGPGSRIADPNDPARVYSWLLCSSHDDRGNAIAYEYKAEDLAGVDRSHPAEAHRTAAGVAANRYLKRIRYGNRVSRLLDPDLTAPDWAFEVVLDYGEHDTGAPTPAEDRPWTCRADPSSAHRSGFEIRTYRLCRRVLMFHHFPDEPGVGAGCLVGSLELGYAESPVLTLLTSATRRGHRRSGDGYLSRAMPPVEFGYQALEPAATVVELDPASLAALPGPGQPGAQWVDLDGDGVPGLLVEQAASWHFHPNLGGGRFAPAQPVPALPSALGLADGRARLVDLAGDGRLDLVSFAAGAAGFAERDGAGGWGPFTPFAALPAVDFGDPNVRLADLDGDGRADVLVTEQDAVTWYPSLGEDGFGPPNRLPAHPAHLLDDREQSVHLADMTGDGLADLVLVRSGEVCYWPGLGHGRFGARVAMAAPPVLAAPAEFDPGRVRLADVDGSGPADLLYLDGDGVRIWRNEAGNGFDGGRRLAGFPRLDAGSSATVTDLLGIGTAQLVWSTPLPGDAGHHVRYADLTGGVKPHLLTSVRNNFGGETRIGYAPSTAFLLADRAAGRPWATSLPFPVHVVERFEIVDHVARSRFVTRYAYHHGHFDGAEREFRGFGMVEQWDIEHLDAVAPPAGPEAAVVPTAPPVLTRTWFHTGAEDPDGRLSRRYAAEYWTPPGTDPAGPAGLLDDAVLPPGLGADERREACRALRGTPLRREVYALDGTDRAGLPYTVSETTATVRLIQPRAAGNRHAVVLVHGRETLDLHHERVAADPRVAHTLTLAVDEYGNVLRSASVAYGRAAADPELTAADRFEQTRIRITVSEQRFTGPILAPAAYRTPLPAESSAYELLGVPGPGASGRYTFDELRRHADTAAEHDLPFEHPHDADPPAPGPHRRILSRSIIRYRRDDLEGPLPEGTAGSLALPYDTRQLAFTPGLLARAYGDVDGPPVDEAMLTAAGYVPGGGAWWVPSGRTGYGPPGIAPADELALARRHFFTQRSFTDPFGNTTTVEPDRYDLTTLEVRDPLGNTTTAGVDYRLIRPAVLTHPNGNRTAVAYDALGLVVATALLGRPGEPVGDTLDGIAADLPEAAIAADLADPLADPEPLLGAATTRVVYDLGAYLRSRESPEPQGAAVHTLARRTHAADLGPGERTEIEHALTYTDGLGRDLQRKALVAPGPLAPGGPLAPVRWVGTGWTVRDGKDRPVRSYEPFFTATHRLEFARTVGVSPIACLDPLGRSVAVLRPDHTYDRAVFDPWRQERWDGNDTVLLDPATDPVVRGFTAQLPPADYLPTWHAQRAGGALGPAEAAAAAKAAAHAGTPSVAHLDSLGRTFRTDGRLANGELLTSRALLDVTGRRIALVDARGRTLERETFSVHGQSLRKATMDAGVRWVLPDVGGAPCHSWDSLGRHTAIGYDALRRPTDVRLAEHGGPETVVGRTVYGEDLPDAAERNLRGAVYRTYDGAGATTTVRRDFKGNAIETRRAFTAGYRDTPDWSAAVTMEPAEYTTLTRHDALNRVTQLVAPHAGDVADVVQPGYDEGGQLDRVDVWSRRPVPAGPLPAASADLPAVTRIEYDARGRRALTECGNGAVTRFEFDPLTFRPRGLTTHRNAEALQDLRYTYDPAGNVTRIADLAQQTLFFRNQAVEATADYTYDALYRLVEATGREQVGAGGPQPAGPDDPAGAGIGRYTERYTHDPAGNLLELVHAAANGADGWTRRYEYDDPSGLEPGVAGNRLTRTVTGGGPGATYTHDAHGNITAMPHLSLLAYDHAGRMRATARQVVTAGTPETTYYTYDNAGQRARKVTDRSAAPAGPPPTRASERLYLGGFEIYREYAGDGVTVVLERETLHVPGGSARLALVETRTAGSDAGATRLVRYQYGNHLGSAVLELDEAAQVISYEEYHPYGSTAYRAARSALEAPKRYRFTGRERDAETGLSYHGARYYAPWLGRWTTPDPIGTGDGPNLYCYVGGAPTTRTDTTGTTADTPDTDPPPSFLSKLRDVVETLLSEEVMGKMVEEYKARLRWEKADRMIAAAEVLQARDDGLVALGGDVVKNGKVVKEGIVSQQLREIATAPDDKDIGELLQLGTAHILLRMVERARERRAQTVADRPDAPMAVDITIYSLNRKPEKPDSTSPHRNGSALDIGRYAGYGVHFSAPQSSMAATSQFYADMLGDGSDSGPVAAKLGLGLVRLPKMDPAGAAKEQGDAFKRPYYTWEQRITPKLESTVHYILKPEWAKFGPFFLPREAKIGGDTPDVGNVIGRFVDPGVRSTFERLRASDPTDMLKYVFADGWDHFHVDVQR
ncbi:SpvB/TcaC N-terminal domain-containing protein [Dactylosporangium sp. CS-033363]|uniref:SpvB/TcaC N-terminal domain-containing protein n=1 Tax=Dactylosporangium sp. CS-033363 TaxID=3239935 RepID=UPI003D9108A7